MYWFSFLTFTVLLFFGLTAYPALQGAPEKKKEAAPAAVKAPPQAKPKAKAQAKPKAKAQAKPKAKPVPRPVPIRETLLPIYHRGEKAPALIKVRGDFEFFLYARKGQRIPVTFTNHPMNDLPIGPAELILSTPKRPRADKKIIPHRNKLTYSLRAGETGVYSFQIRPREPHQAISIDCTFPGQAFFSSKKLLLSDCSGTLFFAVPAGVKKVTLTAEGAPGKESDITLLFPDGQKACEKKKIKGKILLSALRKNPSRNEIWGVRFNASHLSLQVNKPILPLFSTSPANLLVKKGTQRRYRMVSSGVFSERDAVRNGDFRLLERTNRRFKITSPKFPRFWGGNGAALYTSKDLRNHIDFTHLLWTYLSLPAPAGKFKGEITLSGKGEVTAYLRTSPGRAPYTIRKPHFGPFRLTAKPKTFTFTFTKAERESGYIYIKGDEKQKTNARLSQLKITPIP